MGRKIKIALWMGALVLGVLIAAFTFGHPLQIPPERTLKQYMREVVEQGTPGDVAKRIAAQYAGTMGQDFDAAGFQRDMEACLRQRIDAWIDGDDPRLANRVDKDDVDDLAGKFTSACLAEVAKPIR